MKGVGVLVDGTKEREENLTLGQRSVTQQHVDVTVAFAIEAAMG